MINPVQDEEQHDRRKNSSINLCEFHKKSEQNFVQPLKLPIIPKQRKNTHTSPANYRQLSGGYDCATSLLLPWFLCYSFTSHKVLASETSNTLPIYSTHCNGLTDLYESCSFKTSLPTCLYIQDTNVATVSFIAGLLSACSHWGSTDTTRIDATTKNEHLTLRSLHSIHLHLNITCIAFSLHMVLKV